MGIIDLEKRAEKVGIILEKRQIVRIPPVRVGMALDVSGSAEHLYRSGIIQATVERLLAVAMRFDDNGEMDMWSFTHNYNRLPPATKEVFATYVQSAILDDHTLSKWEGTSYAPVMADMLRYYFDKVPPKALNLWERFKAFVARILRKPTTPEVELPALGFFITDGANDDPAKAAALLRQAQGNAMYWQLVGVGDPSLFGFLESMADELPNVGFLHLPHLRLSDDALYEKLLSEELCAWVKAR